MIVQCAYCGKDVKRKPSAVKRYPISYCDKSCKIKAQLKETDLREKGTAAIREWGDSVRAFHECSWCGKEFRRECGETSQRKTCSYECSRSWNDWAPLLNRFSHHGRALLILNGNMRWVDALMAARSNGASRWKAQKARQDPWVRKLQAIVASVKKRYPAGKKRQKNKVDNWDECFKYGIRRLGRRALNDRRTKWQRKFSTMERNHRRRFQHRRRNHRNVTG